ncbi:engulfment and cell motility ELM family protein [Tieghemostelium lacteum]|uniref:Engulfment and cell motility ELM family protein n=1 Tax=Tieghemostelium lacteum TaxID=361077 RepID=A0A151ZBW2_TIELA|nr:engulfment and cell motility ELM family protein [Tieghemostelium lacteum]|eukprot:KYQ91428.1 engulfment and cell motility ELM family protein [Tieghemostelium lacteum]
MLIKLQYQGQVKSLNTIDLKIENINHIHTEHDLHELKKSICTLLDIPIHSEIDLLSTATKELVNDFKEDIDIVVQLQPNSNSSTPVKINSTYTSSGNLNSILENLESIEHIDKKKYLFQLKDLLNDVNNIKIFLEKGGIKILDQLLDKITGNSLSYMLVVIMKISSYPLGVLKISVSLIEKIIKLFTVTDDHGINLNILKHSLAILSNCCLEKSNEFLNLIHQSTSTTSNNNTTSGGKNQFYSKLVGLLTNCQDVDVQKQSLSLMVNILLKSEQIDELHFQIFNILDQLNINESLRKLYPSSIVSEHKTLILSYQKVKLKSIFTQKSVSFEWKLHETLLTSLWASSFPNNTAGFPGRTSELYKHLGFSTDNPSLDLNSPNVGVMGLELVTFFGQNYQEIYQKILTTQNTTRKGREYSIIAVSNALVEILNEVLINSNDIHPTLISTVKPVEEIFSISFQLFDYTYDNMNSTTSIDLTKVLASVRKKQIIDVLNKSPTTMQSFKYISFRQQNNLSNYIDSDKKKGANNVGQLVHSMSNNNLQIYTYDENSELVIKTKVDVKRDIMEIIKYQKLNYLLGGFTFKLSKSSKGKLPNLFIRLNTEQTELNYVYYDTNEKPTTLPNSIKINEITVTTEIVKKKANDATFIIYFGNNEQNEFIQTDDTVHLCDGIKILNGKQPESIETVEEIKSLESIELRIRLIDFQGTTINNRPLTPDPPPDLDFHEVRLKRYYQSLANSANATHTNNLPSKKFNSISNSSNSTTPTSNISTTPPIPITQTTVAK